MKVSHEWLSQYVDLSGYTPVEVAELLTRGGVEVDGVEQRNKGLSDVVVGLVTAKEQHPNADKLSVCMVDVGQEEQLQIVCGAPNVAAGQKVPVAMVGAVLPGDFKIKKAKLRGVESQGMICSAEELGMNDRLLSKEFQEGILVLPHDVALGADVIETLALNDEILELDLTPNRADCLSMIGIAYEMSAILDREVKLPNLQLTEDHNLNYPFDVSILSETDCTHYACRIIDNIEIGPSPIWMQNRLMAAGFRPINNVVDITNYVMLECGQPLHAFDAERLAQSKIEVRHAREGETMVTLDGTERKLDSSMLLITDGTEPIALAGVMGGANSEVTTQTTRIVLESAKFSGMQVRKTSKTLGLRSEASLRFEKETDHEAVIPALDRAAQLIAQYANGTVVGGIIEDRKAGPESKSMPLSLARINQYLGTSMTFAEVKDIFRRLQFTYSEDEATQTLHVTVPSRRGTMSLDVDLIEEVARLYGYDNIPTTLTSGVTTPGALSREQLINRWTRRWFADRGCYEVINYSLTDRDKQVAFPGLYPQSQLIPLAMPMSEERSVLRTSLIPHLLDNAVYNRNRNSDRIALFELSHVFLTDEHKLSRLPEEKVLLSALLSGKRTSVHWSNQAEKVDFYDLKGLAELLFDHLGIEGVTYEPAQVEGFHPGRTAAVKLMKAGEHVLVGYIGQLHPEMQQQLELEDTYVMELEWETIIAEASFEVPYRALPRYPAIGRDIALVVNEQIPAASIVAKVKESAGALLESIQVFDVYTDERLGEDNKSVALSLVYRHAERTLTDEEVSERHEQVVRDLESSFAAQLRQV